MRKLLSGLYRTFLTFVRDYGFFLILSIMPLPLLGSIAAGHRTIRFLFLFSYSHSYSPDNFFFFGFYQVS
jgi:hypothetical protein